jgi:hypothetical protein
MTTKLALDGNAKPIQVLRPSTTTVLNVSGSAVSTSAIAGDVRVIRLASTVDCHYTLNATATTSAVYLPANSVEYIHILDRDYVSVITSGATGSTYVTEMS